MDINKLKQIIEDSLKDGVFNLDTAKLESPGITVIATHYLPDAALALADAKINASAPDSITVNGTGTAIPFKDLLVAAKFYILQDNAALTMTATGDKDWTLDKSIPAFKDTLGASVKFTADPPPVLSLLSDDEQGLQEGLTFTGTIDFSGMSYGVSSLLGIKQEALQGPVTLKDGGKEFVSIDFQGPEVKGVNLWLAKDCTVDFKMENELILNPASKKKTPIPNISLVTTIPFTASGKQYELPLSVQITDLDSFIRLSANITDVINASLDALSKFIGGANLQSTIPEGYHIQDYVEFKELFIDFDVKGTSIEMIGLQVNSTSPWTIVTIASTGKTFRAENVSLSFDVLTPFSGAKPSLFLAGDITLTDRASLYVSAGYPNFEVQGYLKEGYVLNIREFVENFVGSASGIPEELYISELGFDLQSGDYSFEIEIDGYWPINGEQSLSLIILELGFSVNYTKEVQTAAFNGTIRIGSVDVNLTAKYNASNGESGWLFSGSTGKGQRIEIGEFIAYLTDSLGASKPPEWIRGITLQDLEANYNTKTKDCDFTVTGNIPIAANKELQIKVGFKMEAQEAGGYKKILSGELTVGKSIFSFIFTSTPSDSNISASWKAKDESGYLQFEDIAHAFGFKNVPTIPDGLNLALKEAKLYYDFTDGKQALVIAAESANYGTAVFVAKNTGGEWTYVLGVDIKINISLGDLPLVGSDLESVVGKVGLDGFKLIGATKAIKEDDVKTFNKLIAEKAGTAYPQLPELKEGIESGVYCALELNLGKDNKYELQISTAKKKASEATLLLAAAEEPKKDDNAYWIELQKTIGPLYFDRAGVAYKDGRVSLLLDAALVITALKIDLIALGVSNPLNKFDPSFELSGLNIAYQSGPVTIAAGFLKQVSEGITEYTGSAVINIQAFNLSALGSYASVDGHPSLFIFALITAPPLGGPPVFFVTGVAAGFGYNRGLKLPTIDTVHKFPLTQGFVPNQGSPFKGPDPGAALKVLVKDNVVPVQIGQNWAAAGIQFTSFELLQSFALLSLAFGTSLEIGITGMSTVAIPPKSQVLLAFAQLALSAKILPDKGVVSVEAKLTPASYLLSKDCLLTGGFAFYLWTSPNKNAGDFVVTLGGYHPDFVPPDYYPKVPRLGFNWVVTSEVTIKGGMYFALTPTCVMAGGSLEATYSSGDLRAWFIIGADFIIAWQPYYYKAHMYLSFGVSYTFRLDLLFTTITETISVSLGADLQIWGPDFSGIATIHLWIISFDISFGAGAKAPSTTISWTEFKKSFLPPSEKTLQHEALYAGQHTDLPTPTDTYCLGKITNGLVQDLTAGNKEEQEISWIVNRNTTVLETFTIFPAKEYSVVIRDKNGTPVPDQNLVYKNQAELDARNKDFGVGMVDVPNDQFNSKHIVTLQFEGVLNPKIKYSIFAIINDVPKSLWEKREPGYATAAMVKKVLVGFRITPLAPVPDQSVPIALENFQYHHQPYFTPIVPAKPTLVAGPDNVDGMKVMKDTINSEPAVTARKNIIDTLIKRGVKVNQEVNVKEIAAHAQDFIMAPPVLQYTYWKKPA